MRPQNPENPNWIDDLPLSDGIFDSLFGRQKNPAAGIVENSPQGTDQDDSPAA